MNRNGLSLPVNANATELWEKHRLLLVILALIDKIPFLQFYQFNKNPKVNYFIT